jgi:hypothetical protein
MALFGRGPRPLPHSVPAHDPVPWLEPAETAPPAWRRLLSGAELGVLVVILGVVVAISVGLVLLGAFFLLDFLIS